MKFLGGKGVGGKFRILDKFAIRSGRNFEEDEQDYEVKATVGGEMLENGTSGVILGALGSEWWEGLQ